MFPRVPAPGAMEQKEAIGVLGAEPPIELLDAGARGGEDRPRRPGSSRASASAKSLRIAKWMHGSRLPSASTSTCSSSAATESALVSSVGTTTIVRASSGTPIGEVEARQAARRDRPGDHALSERDRDVGRRDQQQQQRQSRQRAADAPSCRSVRRAPRPAGAPSRSRSAPGRRASCARTPDA